MAIKAQREDKASNPLGDLRELRQLCSRAGSGEE